MSLSKTALKIVSSYIIIAKVFSDVKVHLEEFNPKDGKTYCTKGLLINDTLKVVAKIRGISNERISEKDKVSIYLNKDVIDEILLSTCNDTDSEEIWCEMSPSLIKVYYQAIQRFPLNNALVYVKLYYNGTTHWSNNFTLPTISDPTKANLTVNGSKIDYRNSNINSNSSTFEICCVDAPEPCYIYVFNNLQLLGCNLTCINVSLNRQHKNNLTVGFDICGFKYQLKNNDTCEKSPHITTLEDNKEETSWIPIIVIVIVCFIIVIAVCCLVFKMMKTIIQSYLRQTNSYGGGRGGKKSNDVSRKNNAARQACHEEETAFIEHHEREPNTD